jgi:hypothetical protein
VGKTVKVSAEHASYIFSYHPDAEAKSKAEAEANSRDLIALPSPPQSAEDHKELLLKNKRLEEEIASLRQELARYTTITSTSIGINTSPTPLPRPVNPIKNIESQAASVKRSECVIDFSALEDLLKCSLCQMILLDAVVCR